MKGDVLEISDLDRWANRLEVERASNGYVLRSCDSITVIEENQTDLMSQHEGLLWEIMEHFSFGGSKHDAERLVIARQKLDGELYVK